MTYGIDNPMRHAPPLALEAMVRAGQKAGGQFFLLWEGDVASAWVDYNRHMNEAYYALISSFATDHLLTATGQVAPEGFAPEGFASEGFAPEGFASEGFASEGFVSGEGPSEARAAKTVFTAESHIRYLAECKQHQPLKAYFRLLGFDQKRHHHEILICHAGGSDEAVPGTPASPASPACVIEQMLLCYDQQAERVGTWSDEVKSWLLKIFEAQQGLALTPSFAYLFRVRGPEAHSVLGVLETSPRHPEEA